MVHSLGLSLDTLFTKKFVVLTVKSKDVFKLVYFLHFFLHSGLENNQPRSVEWPLNNVDHLIFFSQCKIYNNLPPSPRIYLRYLHYNAQNQKFKAYSFERIFEIIVHDVVISVIFSFLLQLSLKV